MTRAKSSQVSERRRDRILRFMRERPSVGVSCQAVAKLFDPPLSLDETSKLLRSLMTRGDVGRFTHAGDARRVEWRLTPKGLERAGS